MEISALQKHLGLCKVHDLSPYEELEHVISTRETMIHSTGGLSEPGTLYKNLMDILKDVVICYDGITTSVHHKISKFHHSALV